MNADGKSAGWDRSPVLPADRQSCAGLRILFAVDSLFPRLGGAERQALKLATALRERGAFVEFVAPRVQKSQSLLDDVEGFTVHRVDYPHIRWLGSLMLMAAFARYLSDNRHRFDAVHIHITHILAAAAGFSRHKTGLPVLAKISGFYEFEGGVLDHGKRFLPLNYLIRKGLRQVDYVQTISVETREKLLRSGFRNEQIRFIPNGIDTLSSPVPVAQDSELTLGYCGRLREVKGVHILLQGFALAKRQRPDHALKLAIAGAGETADALAQQAERLGISAQVEWVGVLEHTRNFYQSLDIYVQPSFAEGLPNSVMEAMLEARPVIASDIGGNNELVEHGVSGLRFPAGRAQALADQIIRLIDEPALRDSLAQTGRQLIVDRFGFDLVVEQLSGLYRVKG